MVDQLGAIAQGALADLDIRDQVLTNLRSQAKYQSQQSTRDRRHLSKARVINSEDVVALREEREAKDQAKLAKKNTKKNRKLEVKSQPSSISTPSKVYQKRVRIASEASTQYYSPSSCGTDSAWENSSDSEGGNEEKEDSPLLVKQISGKEKSKVLREEVEEVEKPPVVTRSGRVVKPKRK